MKKEVNKPLSGIYQKEMMNFHHEFGHLECDTIVDRHHGSAVITLIEKMSRLISTIRPEGRKACDIEKAFDSMFSALPTNLFKSITFDCGKEFSNWKSTCN